jgi:hypothetical protein
MITGKDPHDATPMDTILASERALIREYAKKRSEPREPDQQATVGLALSGGGLRSVTFSLGVLQALAETGLLGRIDYLSSTGGGSLLAGWLITWIRRTGIPDVEHRLQGTPAAREDSGIQSLRQSTYLSSSGSSSAILHWIPNVILSLLTLCAVLGAFLVLIDIGYRWLNDLTWAKQIDGVLLVTAAVVLAVLIRYSERPPAANANAGRLRVFWAAVMLTLAASALAPIAMNVARQRDPWTVEYWLPIGAALTLFITASFLPSELGGAPRGDSFKVMLSHFASTLTAAFVGGLAIAQLLLWAPAGFITPLVAIGLVLTLLLYIFVMGVRIPDTTREFAIRYCASLANLAAVWFLVAVVWNRDLRRFSWFALTAGIILVAGGLLKACGVSSSRRPVQLLLDVLEQSAPYFFVLVLAAAVVPPIGTWVIDPNKVGLEIVVTVGLLATALLLVWRLRANELTMHSIQRSRLARTYLRFDAKPSSSGNRDGDPPCLISQIRKSTRDPTPLLEPLCTSEVSRFLFFSLR